MKSLAGSSALRRTSMACPALRDVLLAQAQRFASGDPDHLGHQIEAGDHLGHRVFDLDARVHLDEVERARAHRQRGTRPCRRPSSRPIGPGCRRTGRECPAMPSSSAVEGASSQTFCRRRCKRAFAFPAVDGVGAVAEHLHLDVPGALDDLFDVDAAVAERCLRLGRGLRRQRLRTPGILRRRGCRVRRRRRPP